MSLKNIHNKYIGFYTTPTSTNIRSTHLPIAMKNSGAMIISYSIYPERKLYYVNSFDENLAYSTYWGEPPHIWVGGEHIASGFGVDTLDRRDALTYLTDTYTAVWSYLQTNNYILPIWQGDAYRSVILKDNNSFASYNGSIALGIGAVALNENEFVTGKYNNFTYTGNNLHTSMSHGIGEAESRRKNAFEIITNGDFYLYGLGDYDGVNIGNATTVQSYIINSYAYTLDFSQTYTTHKINDLIGGAPEVLDTLKEISDWISDNGNVYQEVVDYNVLNNSNIKDYYIWNWNNTIDDYDTLINNAENNEKKYLIVERLLYKYYISGIHSIVDIVNKLQKPLEEAKEDTIYKEAYDAINNIDGDDDINKDELYHWLDSLCTAKNIDMTGSVGKAEHYSENSINNFYNYLTRFIPAKEYNTNTKYYSKISNTNLVNQVHDIQTSYVTASGPKSNISNAWVNALDNNVMMSDIIYSLLDKPEYIKPELTYILTNTDTNEQITYVEIGKDINITATIISNIKNETGYSYSYGWSLNNANQDNNNIQFNISASNNQSAGTYVLLPETKYTYMCSSYLYYPQLLQNGIEKVSYVGWYDAGENMFPGITVGAKPKLYYSFNEINYNINTKYSIWVNDNDPIIIPLDGSNISGKHYDKIHLKLPKGYTITKTNGFNILLHNALGDSELLLNTVSVKNTNNILTITTDTYKAQYIMSSKNTYIKFTLTKE